MTKEKDNNKIKKNILAALIILITAFGGMQIFFTNQVATQGEKLQEYKEKLAQRRRQVETLEKELQVTASLSYIENKARENLNMVKMHGQIIYLRPQHFAAAQ